VIQVSVRAIKNIDVIRLGKISNSSVFKWIEEGADVENAYTWNVLQRTKREHDTTF